MISGKDVKFECSDNVDSTYKEPVIWSFGLSLLSEWTSCWINSGWSVIWEAMTLMWYCNICVIWLEGLCVPKFFAQGLRLVMFFVVWSWYTLWLYFSPMGMITTSSRNIFRVTGPCEGNAQVTGGFSPERPVTRSFKVFFDLLLNKRLSKQSKCRWFETTSRSLWRHCNGQSYVCIGQC